VSLKIDRNSKNLVWNTLLILSIVILILVLVLDGTFVQRWFVADGEMDSTNHFFLLALRILAAVLALSGFGIWLLRDKLSKEYINLLRSLKTNNHISYFSLVVPIKKDLFTTLLLSFFFLWAAFICYAIFFNPELASSLCKEDGYFESITVILYLVSAFIVFVKIFKVDKRNLFLVLWMSLFALFCIFIAGEEISWGQNYLNFDTPDLLKEANYQGESGIHNVNIPGLDPYFINDVARMLAAFCGIIIPSVLWFSVFLRKTFHFLKIVPPSALSVLYFVLAFCIPGESFIPSLFDSEGNLIILGNLESELREVTLSFAFVIWSYSILGFKIEQK
jgi:hypothetical protein